MRLQHQEDWTWTIYDDDAREIMRVNTKGVTRRDSYRNAMAYARQVHGERASYAACTVNSH